MLVIKRLGIKQPLTKKGGGEGHGRDNLKLKAHSLNQH
jgi:hypothetical protein